MGIKQAAEEPSSTSQKKLFPKPEPEWVEVDAKRVRVENCREFGRPWLALELIKTLGLDNFLQETILSGREDVAWSVMALVLVIARLCDPSSELSIAENFLRKTATSDLLGVPAAKVYDNRLYRALDQWLPHKQKLEVFLKEKLGTLFELEYDLLLYDVTSTYFEGEAKANPLAQHGYSRDKRSDCKQVCIGLVVSRCGMPLGYEVFAGSNRSQTGARLFVNCCLQGIDFQRQHSHVAGDHGRSDCKAVCGSTGHYSPTADEACRVGGAAGPISAELLAAAEHATSACQTEASQARWQAEKTRRAKRTSEAPARTDSAGTVRRGHSATSGRLSSMRQATGRN